jgi:hypothetical protein
MLYVPAAGCEAALADPVAGAGIITLLTFKDRTTGGLF